MLFQSFMNYLSIPRNVIISRSVAALRGSAVGLPSELFPWVLKTLQCWNAWWKSQCKNVRKLLTLRVSSIAGWVTMLLNFKINVINAKTNRQASYVFFRYIRISCLVYQCSHTHCKNLTIPNCWQLRATLELITHSAFLLWSVKLS